MTPKELNTDIKDGTKTWECIGMSDIPVFYLYYYYPTSIEMVEDYQEWARMFVWDFKIGKNSLKVAKQVTEVLNHFFLKDTLSSLTFVCIPASTKRKYHLRFEKFSYQVARDCGMNDGYDHIWVDYDRDAKHQGGEEDFDNLRFDKKWFKGKKILLFDDVITQGNSIKNMTDELEGMGATVIGAVTLGRTVHNDRGEDPYDKMDWPAKIGTGTKESTKHKVNTTEESVRLFKKYGDAAVVAQERGLAEGTIYTHLFNTETLDPHEYITDDEYKRAVRIYEGGYEHPAAMLDEFLDVAGKVAFYYIRRHENNKDSQAEARRATLINIFDDDD